MRRFILTISLAAAACGPGQHHDTTPSAKPSASASDDQNSDLICNSDEPTDPRAPTRPKCRRRSDVDADKRAAQDVVNYGRASTRGN
ncbi:MAG TPA: hypothetical protein VFP84_02955 [Kofleriaceae bacterium]|nr:hypothetical protein [Kofleriaceae bacterium]